jgi:hypothetical protein
MTVTKSYIKKYFQFYSPNSEGTSFLYVGVVPTHTNSETLSMIYYVLKNSEIF